MPFNINVTNKFLEIIFFVQVICVLTSSGILTNEYVIDQGKNLTLSCNNKYPVMWVREGRTHNGNQQIQKDGSLILTNIAVIDAGVYTCYSTAEEDVSVTSTATVSASVTAAATVSGAAETIAATTAVPSNISDNNDSIDSFKEILRAKVKVRTTPGPVSAFSVRATTIIAVIVWEVMPNRTGGYAVRDFTTELRKLPQTEEEDKTTPWERMDPHHISPNARMLEIYHLVPNTTYEFRIWANNHLGAGEIVTIQGTTSPIFEEKDLIKKLMIDAKNFDTRIWILAVSVVLGTLLILSLGTCIVLYKECHEPPVKEERLDSLELVPNIILNPGFCESDGEDPQKPPSPPFTRTFSPFSSMNPSANGNSTGSNNNDDEDDDYDEDDEPQLTFSRKMSIFFTGNTIKRI